MAQTAAGQIWPHLQQATPNEVAHRRTPTTSDAIWPTLSREAKQREADQALWDACCKRARDNFLKTWRAERGR
jgi:hypothetical protein